MLSSLCWSSLSILHNCVFPTQPDGLGVSGDKDSIGSLRVTKLIMVFKLNPGVGGGVEKSGDGWVDRKRGAEVAGEKNS